MNPAGLLHLILLISIVFISVSLGGYGSTGADDSEGGRRTLLHYAAKKGNYKLARFLIENGADPNAIDKKYPYKTPLHEAAEHGHIRMVELLLENGADPNIKSSSETPLHLAARNAGNEGYEIGRLLIEHGADVNAQGISYLPLQDAAISGAADLAKLLIENGADPNAKRINNHTPLYYSVYVGFCLGNSDIARVEECNCKNKLETTRVLIENGADVRLMRDVETPLHITDCWQIAEFLISKGFDVNAMDMWGDTPLHSVVDSYEDDANKLLLAKVLLQNGADVNAVNNEGFTPIYYASTREMIDLLVSYGAKLDIESEIKVISLFEAVEKSKVDLVELLLDNGVDVNSRDDGGFSPLHLASEKSVAELLIRYGADVNAKDVNGLTPLHVAACSCYMDVAETYIEAGADINSYSDYFKTPLHLARANKCGMHFMGMFAINGATPGLKYGQKSERVEGVKLHTDEDKYPLLPADSEDYAVYSDIINSRYIDENIKMIVIGGNTDILGEKSRLETGNRSELLKEDIPLLTPDIITSFIDNNKNGYALGRHFILDVEYQVLGRHEFRKYFGNYCANSWTGFYEDYPHSAGVIDFSRVGYNKDGTKAFVWVINWRGRLCIEPYYLLLSKVDGKWKVIDEYMPWIS